MYCRSRFRLCAAAFALLLSHITPAAAANIDALMKALEEQSARLTAQEQALEESRKNLDMQQKALLQERVRFNQLKAEITATTGRTLAEPKPIPIQTQTAQANAPDAQTTAAAPQEVGVERKHDPEKPPEIAAIIDQGGVLTPKGRVVYTPSIEYARSSATRVAIQGFSTVPAINIGLFEITKTDRDTFTAASNLRYGVTNRFEIETKVPYVYRSDATRTRPIGTNDAETLSTVEGYDIGDVEFGAHYQINNGQGGWPFFIGNLRFKTATGTNPYEVPINSAGVESELPTGSGFYALQPSVTAIYPSDPVVFYSNVGYLYNFSRDFGGTIGEIDPGDSVNASFGMSLSLNERASISFGYSHNTAFKPKQNGFTVPNSTIIQAGSLDLGYSYMLTDQTNLNLGISAGITEDAPDARITFRVPMSFDLN